MQFYDEFFKELVQLKSLHVCKATASGDRTHIQILIPQTHQHT